MKTTLIVTVLNEEDSIEQLLDSIAQQSKLPDEIIISDGGSTDRTVEIIKKSPLNIKVLIKPGNRAFGRNEAIKAAKNDVILCTDAGCILDKKWVEAIIQPFSKKTIDVVAGYYTGKSETIFQKSLVPYVLVMPDKVDARTFLPASRSVAFRKKIWEKVGGFDEKLSHNEDYAFANLLVEKDASIFFTPDALVYWIPRSTVKSAFIMFYRFALGDIEAKLLRPKVVLILLRYIFAFLFLLSFLLSPDMHFALLGSGIIFVYIYWSIKKNFRYVQDIRALFLLPFIQVLSDIAVISGTVVGMTKKK